jgi:hypothetical protein
MGWVELIREFARGGGAPGDLVPMTDEMQRDLERLEKVSLRFNQIGSTPRTKRQDIVVVLRDAMDYLRWRLEGLGRGITIEEHYTDTAGFTDHVFGLMPFVGFRFAPRIRDLGETKLFVPHGHAVYDGLKPMISTERLKIKQIRAHWDEILRLAASIQRGAVTASLMLRKAR